MLQRRVFIDQRHFFKGFVFFFYSSFKANFKTITRGKLKKNLLIWFSFSFFLKWWLGMGEELMKLTKIKMLKLTRSAIMMSIDCSWRITVGFSVNWHITISRSGDSFSCGTGFIIDTSEWWCEFGITAQWFVGTFGWGVLGTNIVRSYLKIDFFLVEVCFFLFYLFYLWGIGYMTARILLFLLGIHFSQSFPNVV